MYPHHWSRRLCLLGSRFGITLEHIELSISIQYAYSGVMRPPIPI